MAIAEIKKFNKTLYNEPNSPNTFYYKLFDEFGESHVVYLCEGKYVRKVVINCIDATQAIQRSKQAFKTVNSNYSVDRDKPGVFVGTNSCFFEGTARYETIISNSDRTYSLEIILID